ncbi:MAG: hypothetical protein HKP27_14720 [Myxococcales bacterium]|nr:hypothetical protein [Myxococcales bacterium]
MSDTRVRMLAPQGAPGSAEAALPSAASDTRPFSAPRQQTLALLSRRILRDDFLRQDPASVALGYWLRSANVKRLCATFEARAAGESDTVFVPVGRVFHVAPGNVDTVFVYSWALAFLCGNQNVVRVSTEQGAVLERLLAVISVAMGENEVLASGNRFVTYAHDREVSKAFSLWATHRVLWGGDETIDELRTVPLSPNASERAFGSKFSYCAIALPTFVTASQEVVEALAAGFFNDLFWFDQMACSSPHVIVWVGSAEQMHLATDRFHAALEKEIERRGYRGDASSALHRLNYAFDLACDTDIEADPYQHEFLGVRLRDGERWRKEICGAGLFAHLRLDSLAELAERAEEGDQTVTHFGFERAALREFAAAAGARGVDRIVPIGEALAFEPTWDGYDLVADFTRRVSFRGGS